MLVDSQHIAVIFCESWDKLNLIPNLNIQCAATYLLCKRYSNYTLSAEVFTMKKSIWPKYTLFKQEFNEVLTGFRT